MAPVRVLYDALWPYDRRTKLHLDIYIAPVPPLSGFQLPILGWRVQYISFSPTSVQVCRYLLLFFLLCITIISNIMTYIHYFSTLPSAFFFLFAYRVVYHFIFLSNFSSLFTFSYYPVLIFRVVFSQCLHLLRVPLSFFIFPNLIMNVLYCWFHVARYVISCYFFVLLFLSSHFLLLIQDYFSNYT